MISPRLLVLLRERLRAGPHEVRPTRTSNRTSSSSWPRSSSCAPRGTRATTGPRRCFSAWDSSSTARPSWPESARRRLPPDAPERLRRKEVWQGLLGAAFLAGGWMVARGLHYHLPSGSPVARRRGPSTSPRERPVPTRSRAPRYWVWPILPLYGTRLPEVRGAGLFRIRAWRATVVLLSFRFRSSGSSLRLGRQAFSLLPVSFLHLSSRGRVRCARRLGGRGRFAAVLACAYLVRLSSGARSVTRATGSISGFDAAGLPRGAGHELERPLGKEIFHLAGARVLRLHGSFVASFSRGLFDFRLRAAECVAPVPSSACLVALKANVDRLFAPGEAVGFSPPGSPADRPSSAKHFSDILGRPACRG